MKHHSGHHPDLALVGLIGLMIIFGLVMLSSAGSVFGFQRFQDSNFFLKSQLPAVGIGLVGLFLTYRTEYSRWRKWAVPMLFVTIILLLLVFMPGIGSFFLGARRWINLGFTTIQPSEIAKLVFVLYLAAWFEKRTGYLRDVHVSLVPFLITVATVGGLILAEPDLGTTIVLILVSLAMYFVAGAPWRHLLGIGSAGIALIIILIKIAPYRAQRFTVFLNPDLDPQGIGYHINQALLAIGSGGWFGVGLGHSRQKFNYLPEPAGDSIFAVTAEELGFVFVTFFILAWCFLIYRGFQIARHAPDQFGSLVATGITAWLGFQAFLNIGALSGLLPLTGIPLPLMSHGGSAMIVNLTGLGILLNISRYTVRSQSRR